MSIALKNVLLSSDVKNGAHVILIDLFQNDFFVMNIMTSYLLKQRFLIKNNRDEHKIFFYV